MTCVRERLQRRDGCYVLHYAVDALGELRLMQGQTMSTADNLPLVSNPQRQALLGTVADLVSELPRSRILRLAVDGVDGAGKTTFANALAAVLQERGQFVIRASVDAFHNPKARRYERGSASPEGFFRDSYDYKGLKKVLLDPLSPGGTGRYRTAIFDHNSDLPISVPELQAPSGSILVFDGIFCIGLSCVAAGTFRSFWRLRLMCPCREWQCETQHPLTQLLLKTAAMLKGKSCIYRNAARSSTPQSRLTTPI